MALCYGMGSSLGLPPSLAGELLFRVGCGTELQLRGLPGNSDMAANKQHAQKKCHCLFTHSASDTVAHTGPDCWMGMGCVRVQLSDS